MIARLKSNKSIFSSESGITLIELLVVIGILSILMAIAFISVSNIQIISTNSNTISVLASDLKAQQTKAMTGDSEGRGTPDNYGIKILTDSYVFFHGNSFDPQETSNFSIEIPTGFTLSSTFPNNTILFASRSGEIIGFVEGQSTITLTNNQTNQSRAATLNAFGTVLTIN